MMRAEILSVGDEVVSGQIEDTNSAWLSQRLLDLGIPVGEHVAVGDEEKEIADAVRVAASRAAVVVVTGGLGPTHDDVTREAVAAAAGAELVLHPPSLDHIKDIFASRGMEMPLSNERQADIPRGGDVLPNATGTAPGFRVRVGAADVFVLPGVPSEMKDMFDAEVVPLLPRAGCAFAVRILRCFGMSESLIAETLAAGLERDSAVRLAFLPSEGIISVKFTACAVSREAAEERLRPLAERTRELLGGVVFGEGDDTLELAAARLLESQGKTLALAESCTGGLVAARLTDVPGISRWFLEGVVAYSNEAKVRLLGVEPGPLGTAGAVSEEVARAMAEGVRRRAGADVGVGITGIAGPSGGTLEKPVGTVHVAVATAAGTVHRKLALRGARAVVKDRAAKHALNLLRLELLGRHVRRYA